MQQFHQHFNYIIWTLTEQLRDIFFSLNWELWHFWRWIFKTIWQNNNEYIMEFTSFINLVKYHSRCKKNYGQNVTGRFFSMLTKIYFCNVCFFRICLLFEFYHVYHSVCSLRSSMNKIVQIKMDFWALDWYLSKQSVIIENSKDKNWVRTSESDHEYWKYPSLVTSILCNVCKLSNITFNSIEK